MTANHVASSFRYHTLKETQDLIAFGCDGGKVSQTPKFVTFNGAGLLFLVKPTQNNQVLRAFELGSPLSLADLGRGSRPLNQAAWD